MFTSTPPRNNCNAGCTNEENLLVSTSSATAAVSTSSMQRKRGRSDIMSTAMVSPFVMDQRYDYNNANSSTSSSPMTYDTATTRLEPLIESTDITDSNQQKQQSMPLSQVSTTSTTNSSASSSADPTSPFHNDGTKLIYTTELQPPMKRLKVDNCSDVGGHDNNDVIPLLERKDDEEEDIMARQQPCTKGSLAAKANSTAAAAITKKTSLSKLIGSSGNSSNIVDVSLATMSKMKDVASSPKNSQISCCCHVCGGTGGDATADDVMLTQCSEDIGSGSNNSGGSSCASRSIASYFQVTKKHSPMSSSSSSSRKVTPSSPQSKVAKGTTIFNNFKEANQKPLLPPCRYCDRPTCRNNPSCIKQCEECQHNFCSFCCKVNYTGVYEKTVCFECDELIMLSHCCDRMELG